MSHISIKRAHHSTVPTPERRPTRWPPNWPRTMTCARTGKATCCTLTAAACTARWPSPKDIQVDVKLGLLMAAFSGPDPVGDGDATGRIDLPAPAARKVGSGKACGQSEEEIVLALAAC